jgi:hypothetical protein
MIHMREVQIGNSGQMTAENYHSGTKCQYGIEPQLLSRCRSLRLKFLGCGCLLDGKLVSKEIDFSRATGSRQSVERVSPGREVSAAIY